MPNGLELGNGWLEPAILGGSVSVGWMACQVAGHGTPGNVPIGWAG
jgi:hypothetical protein